MIIALGHFHRSLRERLVCTKRIKKRKRCRTARLTTEDFNLCDGFPRETDIRSSFTLTGNVERRDLSSAS